MSQSMWNQWLQLACIRSRGCVNPYELVETFAPPSGRFKVLWEEKLKVEGSEHDVEAGKVVEEPVVWFGVSEELNDQCDQTNDCREEEKDVKNVPSSSKPADKSSWAGRQFKERERSQRCRTHKQEAITPGRRQKARHVKVETKDEGTKRRSRGWDTNTSSGTHRGRTIACTWIRGVWSA